MKLKGGVIIPGVSISDIFLNMDLKDLELTIGTSYDTNLIMDGRIISIENAEFWINKRNKVYQITVSGDYTGKFRNIGIGSTLADIEKFTPWKEEGEVYVLPEFPGICFELGDTDDPYGWDEREAPIEYITIDLLDSK